MGTEWGLSTALRESDSAPLALTQSSLYGNLRGHQRKTLGHLAVAPGAVTPVTGNSCA